MLVLKTSPVYIIPKFNKIVSLKAIRRGVFAGVFKNERFIPEHALFTCPLFEAVRVINFECDDENVKRFLHGEEISCEAELKGYVQVRINEIPVGFGKASQGRLKNHYPKGLRTL